jgi:hypothetical protein
MEVRRCIKGDYGDSDDMKDESISFLFLSLTISVNVGDGRQSRLIGRAVGKVVGCS